MLLPAKLISAELQLIQFSSIKGCLLKSSTDIIRIKAWGSKIARILDFSTLCAH